MVASPLRRELVGLALLLVAVFLTGALVAHGAASYVEHSGSAFGVVGRLLGGPLILLLGWAGAPLVPLVPAARSLRLFGRAPRRPADGVARSWTALVIGLCFLLPVAAGLLVRPADHSIPERGTSHGVWGALVSNYFVEWFGTVGAWVVFFFAAATLTAVTLAWNPIRVLLGGPRAPAPVAAGETSLSVEAEVAPGTGKRKRRAKAETGVAAGGAATTALGTVLEPAPEEMPALDLSLMDGATEVAEEAPAKADRKKKKSKADVAADRAAEVAAQIDAAEDGRLLGDDVPPVDLLSPAAPRNADNHRRELDAMGAKLMDALRTFRVDGELVGRTTGPVVTQYEIAPAAGVKVRQFANLANDLALAMRAPSIRVVAPIPGKGAVGVEVPNPTPEMVTFRELIESRDFQSARAALPIALGKDLEGRPVIADLAKMPHLLIAGATGSGKSVCVNTIITSLAYRHTPQSLRFLMVDPKMVELSVYNVLPHLRHKVVTDNRDAAAVLKWAVMEMQERYELLAANGARNIQDFNRRVQEGAPLKTPKRPDVAFEDRTYSGGTLPYIVVVIDELADLMMTVQGEVETPLAMLAQKARAIGIHLILATQRPSVNVITGLIKANFPSRIAFRVASQVDSRTILDGVGAEALLGNGDMLFIPPGKSEPSRLQGAYISSEDTERLTGWYEARREARRAAFEAQGLMVEPELNASEPDILEAVRAKEAQDAGGGDGEPVDDSERDKLFRDAAEVVIQNQNGSTSLLQRRLKVGYGRAARIIDQLHLAGVLGPPDGSKPRDVLVGLEDLDRICGGGLD